ncbi:MAG TPA: YggS family pyridoxal phosphate-dependent enzyme [Deltaproteobacteria bacterium]|nr:YggS family pyridoxal phosphate-dependent enzyme [Deltaproteobacteria bacterium]
MGEIRENCLKILSEIPPGVTVVAAAKSKTAEEIREVVDAGITVIGENYLQESQVVIGAIGDRAVWHFIGHIQKNKARHIVPLFDMIQTVDTFALAALIDQLAGKHGKVMPVLVEVNSGREEAKHGAMPEAVADLVRQMSVLPNLRVQGLMTMGPFLDDFTGLRPFFRETKALFEEIRTLNIPNIRMETLSMGMSDSYCIAIEEGATMVRIGTKIFGERSY